MSNYEGYQRRQDVPEQLHAADGGDADRAISRRSPRRSSIRRPAPSAARRRIVPAVPGNRIPTNRIHPTSQQLLEFYPEPNAAGTRRTTTSRSRIASSTGSSTRSAWTSSRARRRPGWAGTATSHDDEVTPALKLNGSKLLNTHSPGDDRQHATRCRRRCSTSSASGSTPSSTRSAASWPSCATSSPSSAFPASVAGPPESWGIPAIGISGYSGFGDSTEGPYTNRNKVFEFIDNLSWIRGTHSFKLGASIRFDQYNQVGNQFSRGSFQFDGRATGSFDRRGDAGRRRVCRFPARLPAPLRSGGRARDDEIPRDQPGVLLHRHVAHARQHDARSRAALRVRAALARQGRHADQRLPAVSATRGCRWPTCRVIPCSSGSATATSTRTQRSGSHPTSRRRATAHWAGASSTTTS